MTGILVRRGKETQEGKMATWRHGDMGRMSGSGRGRGQSYACTSLGLMATREAKRKAWSRVSPTYCRDSVALPTPWFPTSSLQDCERLIKATQFVLLVPAALGNKCTYKNYMVFVWNSNVTGHPAFLFAASAAGFSSVRLSMTLPCFPEDSASAEVPGVSGVLLWGTALLAFFGTPCSVQ